MRLNTFWTIRAPLIAMISVCCLLGGCECGDEAADYAKQQKATAAKKLADAQAKASEKAKEAKAIALREAEKAKATLSKTAAESKALIAAKSSEMLAATRAHLLARAQEKPEGLADDERKLLSEAGELLKRLATQMKDKNYERAKVTAAKIDKVLQNRAISMTTDLIILEHRQTPLVAKEKLRQLLADPDTTDEEKKALSYTQAYFDSKGNASTVDILFIVTCFAAEFKHPGSGKGVFYIAKPLADFLNNRPIDLEIYKTKPAPSNDASDPLRDFIDETVTKDKDK